MKNKLLYIFIFLSAFGFSQSNKVQVEVDTTNIRIGEQFQYKISVDEIENVIIPKLENLKGLEVVDTLKIDTIKNKLVQKYILTGFDSGAFYIPQQQIFIKNQAHLTDSLLINVATVAIDTAKIKKFPIKGIKGEPYQFDDFKNYIYWGIAALLLIALLLYYFVFKKKKVTEEEVIIPLLPPYEEAIQKLKELDEKLLWQNNKIKQYYSELTEIVRSYLGRDIDIATQETTTNEIIDLVIVQNDAKNLNITKDTIANLGNLLKNADLVKFAKSKPLANDIEFDRKTAEKILSNIQPKIKQYKASLILEETKDNFNQSEISNNSNNIIEEKKKKKFSKKHFFISAFVIGFIVAGYYGVSFGKKIYNSVSKFTDTSSTETIYNNNWEEYALGTPSISIITPVKLENEKAPELPENVKKYVQSINISAYKSIINNLQIFLMATKYVPEINADLNGATNSAIAQMQQVPNVKNLTHNVESYNFKNINGSKLTGTYTENTIDTEYEAYCFVKNNNMYMLIISHKKDDSYGKQISNKIVNSIKIEEE
ncbi:MAG: hypothetical protein ACPGU6_04765 [Tenacibaculum sp.]